MNTSDKNARRMYLILPRADGQAILATQHREQASCELPSGHRRLPGSEVGSTEQFDRRNGARARIEGRKTGSSWNLVLRVETGDGEDPMSRFRQSYQADRTPVVVGGDHSISIGVVSAAAGFLRNRDGEEAGSSGHEQPHPRNPGRVDPDRTGGDGPSARISHQSARSEGRSRRIEAQWNRNSEAP